MVLMTYPEIGNYGCEGCFCESDGIKNSGVNLIEAAVHIWHGDDLVAQSLVP